MRRLRSSGGRVARISSGSSLRIVSTSSESPPTLVDSATTERSRASPLRSIGVPSSSSTKDVTSISRSNFFVRQSKNLLMASGFKSIEVRNFLISSSSISGKSSSILSRDSSVNRAQIGPFSSFASPAAQWDLTHGFASFNPRSISGIVLG